MFSSTQNFTSQAAATSQAGHEGETTVPGSEGKNPNPQSDTNADLFLKEMTAFLEQAEVILPDAAANANARENVVDGKALQNSTKNPDTIKAEMAAFLTEAKVVLDGPEQLANRTDAIDAKKPVISDLPPRTKPVVSEIAQDVKPIVSEDLEFSPAGRSVPTGPRDQDTLAGSVQPIDVDYSDASGIDTDQRGELNVVSAIDPPLETGRDFDVSAGTDTKAIIQEDLDAALTTDMVIDADQPASSANGRDNHMVGQNAGRESHPQTNPVDAHRGERVDGRTLGQSVAALNTELPRQTDGRERSTDIQNLIQSVKADADDVPQTPRPDIEKPDAIKLESPGQSIIKPLASAQVNTAAPMTDMVPGMAVNGSPGTPTQITTQPTFSHITTDGAPAQKVAEALALVTQKQDKLVVRLDPPELGRVSIEFQFETNRGITAVISAENADIGSQLREKSEFFFKALKSAGFEDVNLSFDTSSNSSHKEETFSDTGEQGSLGFYRAELDRDGDDGAFKPRDNNGVLTGENINILL